MSKQPAIPEGFQSVEPTPFKWEKPGDTVLGTLLYRQDPEGEINNMRYFIKEEDGSILLVWGTKVLDPKLQLIPDGGQVFIHFREEKQTNKKFQNKTKLFDVYYKESPTNGEGSEEDLPF